MSKMLHIGMSLAPTWLSGEAWRRADSGVEGIFSTDFYIDIAQRAEHAKLDFAFLPDTLYLDPSVLDTGSGFSSLDPTLLLAAIARETSHIGLLSTASTTFFPPYILARQIQSLNWISNGRAGWNVVTALGGHENFGLEEMATAEERYERATEFLDVVKALWESYPHAALLMDRDEGRFADSSQVRPIAHKGTFFNVNGPINLPAYNRSRIPLIQAGASSSGRNFAASIADAIFAATPDKEAAKELRQDLHERAEKCGRRADDIRVLPGLSLFLAETREDARALYMATHARMDRQRKIASIEAMTGLNLSAWPHDKPITAADLPPVPENLRSRTHAELLRRLILRDEPTLASLLLSPEVIGSAHWQIVGTVEDAVEEIIEWFDASAIDGFICVPGGSVSSMHLTLEKMIPMLVARGVFRSEYAGSTFMDHLTDDD